VILSPVRVQSAGLRESRRAGHSLGSRMSDSVQGCIWLWVVHMDPCPELNMMPPLLMTLFSARPDRLTHDDEFLPIIFSHIHMYMWLCSM